MKKAFIILGTIGLFSTDAGAVVYDVSDYTELKTAIESAQDGDTINLKNDITISADLGLPTSLTNLTINGNNHKLLGDGYKGITVASGKSLTINDLNIEEFGKSFTSDKNSDFIINNSTFKNNNQLTTGGAVNINGKITEINADFDSNHIKWASSTSVYAYGGAIYSYTDKTINIIKGNFTNNYAEGNSNNSGKIGAGGGAIYNRSSTIQKIVGDFISNYTNNNQGVGWSEGGAILNHSGKFTEGIEGDFIDNYITGSTAGNFGGAIYSYYGEIGDLRGDYIGNHVDGLGRAGAIYNQSSTIGEISGKNSTHGLFKDNYVVSEDGIAEGGALASLGAKTAYSIIDSINADFIENHIQAFKQASGGALNNNGFSYIREGIKGDFIGNYAVSTGDATLARGGAIINFCFIKSTDGNFISNFAQSSGSGVIGGALLNIAGTNSSGHISTISGDFNDNYALATGESGYAHGGAIYNNSSIGLLTGSFNNNYALSDNSDGFGGAIYNSSNMTVKDTSFVNNAATTAGGAIYNSGELSIIAEASDVDFSGNKIAVTHNYNESDKTVSINGGEANALHNLGTVNMNIATGKTITFNDPISGETGIININKSDNTYKSFSFSKDENQLLTEIHAINAVGGTVRFNADVTQQCINVASGTIDIGKSLITAEDMSISDNTVLEITINELDSFDENGNVTQYGDHGRINVSNSINIAGSAKLKTTLTHSMMTKALNTQGKVVLLSKNNVTIDNNTFIDQVFEQDINGNLIEIADNNMFSFAKEGNTGTYVITKVQDASDIAGKEEGNANSWVSDAARAWVDGEELPVDTAGSNTAEKLATLAQHDATGLNKALKALAPTEAKIVDGNAIENASRLFKIVDGYLRGMHDAMGFSSGDEFENTKIWAKTYIGESKISRRGKIAGSDANSHGVIAGIEKKIANNLKMGTGLQYDVTDIDALSRDIDIHSVYGFVYGEYKPGKWFVNSVTSYGKSDYTENKFALNDLYKAKYDVHMFSMAAMTGYEFGNITPEAGFRYYHITQDGYRDSAGQYISGSNNDILRLIAGVRLSKDFGPFRPEIYTGLTYDAINENNNTQVSLANGAHYTVPGKRLHRLGYEASVSLAVDLMEDISAGINYIGAYHDKYQEHTAMFSLKYQF